VSDTFKPVGLTEAQESVWDALVAMHHDWNRYLAWREREQIAIGCQCSTQTVSNALVKIYAALKMDPPSASNGNSEMAAAAAEQAERAGLPEEVLAEIAEAIAPVGPTPFDNPATAECPNPFADDDEAVSGEEASATMQNADMIAFGEQARQIHEIIDGMRLAMTAQSRPAVERLKLAFTETSETWAENGRLKEQVEERQKDAEALEVMNGQLAQSLAAERGYHGNTKNKVTALETSLRELEQKFRADLADELAKTAAALDRAEAAEQAATAAPPLNALGKVPVLKIEVAQRMLHALDNDQMDRICILREVADLLQPGD
jgi:hypothetical protein